MNEDETTRDEAEQPDDAGQPDAELPDAEQPDDAGAVDPAGEAPAPDAAPQEPEPQGAPAEGEQPTATAPQTDEPAQPPAAADDEAREPKRGDEPPGAGLEPIRLEPERELSAEERARLEAEAEERARREAAATAEGGDEEPARAGAKLELSADDRIQATGKRKNAVARVVLRAGAGTFEVNGRELPGYFPRSLHQTVARQPLVTSGFENQVDVRVRVHGGGLTGQADAVRHGIARALVQIDPELRGDLKRRGMLTRDARVKERRKAGLKKARKRPQFSKR